MMAAFRTLAGRLAARLLAVALLSLAAPLFASPGAAQELRLPEPGTRVTFDNGAVYHAFSIVGDQVFVEEITGSEKRVVHVLRYGRFDSLIFRAGGRSEIYFTQGSVEDLLTLEPNQSLDIAYEVYIDNRLNARVNGVAVRGGPATVEAGGRRLTARPLTLQLFYYDPDGNFLRNVNLRRFFSEDFGLPLRIEWENVTSGEKFAITATDVTLP